MSSPTSATLVYEVQSGGIASDNNGGGFDPGQPSPGTDYTQGGGQQVISWLSSGGTYGAMLSCSGSPYTVISAVGARGFLAADVGNVINLIGGGFTAGRYTITAVSGGSATLDRACCSSAVSAGTGYLGGPLASPGMLGSVLTTGGQAGWIKQATYTLSNSTSNTSGGPGTPSNLTRTEGYKTTRGDRAGRPTISAGSVTFGSLAVVYGSTSGTTIVHVKADANNVNNACGIAANMAVDCEADNATGTGGVYGFTLGGPMVNCKASNCVVGFYISGSYLASGCWASACGTGFSIAATRMMFTDCIASGCVSTIGSNSGLSGDGFASSSASSVFVNCTADGNAGHGFDITGSGHVCINCIASNHTTAGKYGFYAGTSLYLRLDTCACYGNSGGGNCNTNVVAISPPSGVIALTQAPYVSAGSDFRPNATAGGGAALKGAGLGVSQQGEGTGSLDYRAIGACQDTPPTSTDPGVGNVLSGTGYEINGSSLSGTLIVPDVGKVASGTSYGIGGNGSTGTLVLPAAGSVVSGTSYGVGGNGSTGTYPTTAASQAAQLAVDVAVVTAAEASIASTATILGVAGTRTDCPAAKALTTASYGDPASPITGSVDLTNATAGNIKSGVTIAGVEGSYNPMAAAVFPQDSQVQTAVTYGPTGREYTGTLVVPAAGNVLSGTVYGAGGNGSTGTRADCPAADATTAASYGDPSQPITGTLDMSLYVLKSSLPFTSQACSRVDVENIFGAENVQKWADVDNCGDPTTIARRIDWSIAWATNELQDLLRDGPYVVDPLPVTAAVTWVTLTAMLAGWMLSNPRVGEDNVDPAKQRKNSWALQHVQETVRQIKTGLRRINAVPARRMANVPMVMP
jgi:hypothetical protein